MVEAESTYNTAFVTLAAVPLSLSFLSIKTWLDVAATTAAAES